jgi:hypothetical protein
MLDVPLPPALLPIPSPSNADMNTTRLIFRTYDQLVEPSNRGRSRAPKLCHNGAPQTTATISSSILDFAGAWSDLPGNVLSGSTTAIGKATLCNNLDNIRLWKSLLVSLSDICGKCVTC